MASISIIGITDWGNPYSRLPGALGPSPPRGGGLRMPFVFGLGVAGMADHTRPRVWFSPFFQCLVQHDFPLYPRFLRRPRLLTRLSSLYGLLRGQGQKVGWQLRFRGASLPAPITTRGNPHGVCKPTRNPWL